MPCSGSCQPRLRGIDEPIQPDSANSATTAGCLEALDRLCTEGLHFVNIADIGTGTGLLAFAALALWPQARAIATDIDPIAVDVACDNAAINGVALGHKAGELLITTADGMDSPMLAARAPFGLIIANILAGPLIALAGDFADAVAPRGHLLLAGLLTTQEPAVRAACRTAGFRLAARLVNGDWSILWLRRRDI